MANYRTLRVWNKGMELVASTQRAIDSFPRNRSGDLKSQMRRAVISIPSNIAEGANREHESDFRRYLNIALGSCGELQTQIEIAYGLGLIDALTYEPMADAVDHEARMLRMLIKKL